MQRVEVRRGERLQLCEVGGRPLQVQCTARKHAAASPVGHHRQPLPPCLLQCHTAVVDLFLELEDEPSFFKHSSSSSRRQPRGSSSTAAADGGMSPKLRGMMGVGMASLGAMAAFYG